MPLNPEIFFRGAELQARNAAQTQATIGNFFDKLAATKERKLAEEKAKATDYEGSAYRVLMDMQAGRTPDQGDLLRAKAWDTMNQSQNAIDPVTGNAYSKNSSIFGNLQSAGGAQYPSGGFSAPPSMPVDAISIVPQPMGRGALPTGGNMPYVDDIGLGNVNDMVPPIGSNYDEVSGGVDRNAARGIPTPAMTGNRKLDQSNLEATSKAKIDLEKRKLEKEQDLLNLKNEPMNELQGKTATFVDRMREADQIISDGKVTAEQLSLKNRGADMVPLAGNFMVSPNYQKASQAERNFINAVLRRESGAAIAPGEFSNARQQYFPQPGDTPDVITQKKQNRQTAIEGFQREAGPAYTPKQLSETVPDAGEYQTTPSGIKFKVVQ